MGSDNERQREFLTRPEAAKYISARYFSITPRTLAIYASDEMGPPYDILGGRALYREATIDAWIKQAAEPGKAPKLRGALMAGGR